MINDGECGDDGWFFYFFLEVSILGVVTLWEELHGFSGTVRPRDTQPQAAQTSLCTFLNWVQIFLGNEQFFVVKNLEQQGFLIILPSFY